MDDASKDVTNDGGRGSVFGRRDLDLDLDLDLHGHGVPAYSELSHDEIDIGRLIQG
jgi:hypothetical protein